MRTMELLVMEAMASPLVPRYPSPEVGEGGLNGQHDGDDEEDGEEERAGKRYLAGTNLLVEYSRNMAPVVRTTTSSHNHIR